MPSLLFIVDDDSYFCSHRLHEVSMATRVDRHGPQIEQEGFTLYPRNFVEASDLP